MTFDAPRAKVWDALVRPDLIKRYMYVTDVVADWREGGPISWKSEHNGKPFEVRVTVLRFEPERAIQYERSLPIFRPSAAERSRRTRVTIELSDEGSRTRIVVAEEDHATTRELEHSEGGWRLMLNGLKALVEHAR